MLSSDIKDIISQQISKNIGIIDMKYANWNHQSGLHSWKDVDFGSSRFQDWKVTDNNSSPKKIVEFVANSFRTAERHTNCNHSSASFSKSKFAMLKTMTAFVTTLGVALVKGS